MAKIPSFATGRLILRPPSPGDLGDLIALGADPEVMRYIGAGQTHSAVQAGFWLECLLADARHAFPTPGTPSRLPGWLVIIERETQAFVGLAAMAMLPAHQIAAIGPDFCPAPCIEVGYRLAQAHWGKGYATEAARELVRYGFDTLGLCYLVAIADVRNTASNRVLEKLGLQTRKTYSLGDVSIHFRSTSQKEYLAARRVTLPVEIYDEPRVEEFVAAERELSDALGRLESA